MSLITNIEMAFLVLEQRARRILLSKDSRNVSRNSCWSLRALEYSMASNTHLIATQDVDGSSVFSYEITSSSRFLVFQRPLPFCVNKLLRGRLFLNVHQRGRVRPFIDLEAFFDRYVMVCRFLMVRSSVGI